MSARFEDLREELLRGGIAPRHVRRYLRELEEHYADLYAAQREAGFDQSDAEIRARALLGEDENLAKAMLEQRDFRAISARFPWLVFPLTPVPLVVLGWALPVLLLVGISQAYRFMTGATAFIAPDWYRLLAGLLFGFANFAVIPLAILLLTVLIWRQRLSILWLLPALVLLLPLVGNVHGDFPTEAEILQHKKGALSVGIGWATTDLLGQVTGHYWRLERTFLILWPPAALLFMRWRKRLKEDAPAV
ncbi:MAG TPA: hypothetical protein VJ798_13215 [Rhizomicrobium sp.]|nr:hypothetical protein [Rhizomicrobium sp.]